MEADTGERFADADPEYALDAADDVDTEGAGVAPMDPKDMPPEQGDIRSTEPGDED
jgi:hypothetical protein